jgi:3-hydroxybutyryl-CoA dehydrogenase
MTQPDPVQWSEAVKCVAVMGAGTMGEGIAQSFAEAGFMVRLFDPDADAISRCLEQISQNIRTARQRGLAGPDARIVQEHIQPALTPLAAAEGAELVIESAPERLELKRSLFAELSTLPESVVLVTNTSSLTVDAVSEGIARPERVAGLHYFNPAHIIPAVEIHAGRQTHAWVLAGLRALMLRCGKVPLVIRKSIPGLVINRLTAALMREIGSLLDEDVIDPRELDHAVKASIGMRMAWVGPMEGSDFTGLDIGARVQTALFPTLSNRYRPSAQLTQRVERGELGLKSGKGWYEYREGDRERLTNLRNAQLIDQLILVRQGTPERS